MGKYTPTEVTHPPSEDEIRIAFVGLGGCGKTSLIIQYTTGKFPVDWVPTAYDNNCGVTDFEGSPVHISLVDTAGGERFCRLRPLSYANVHAFVLCMSPNTFSLTELDEVFFPETTHFQPEAPKICCMMGADRRDKIDSEFFMRTNYAFQQPPTQLEMVSTKMGLEYALKYGAKGYAECSAKFNIGVEQAIHMAIRVVLRERKMKKENKWTSKIASLLKNPFKFHTSAKREKSPGGNDFFSGLPPAVTEKLPHIWGQVFSVLPLSDILNLHYTCHKFFDFICKNDGLWLSILDKYQPHYKNTIEVMIDKGLFPPTTASLSPRQKFLYLLDPSHILCSVPASYPPSNSVPAL